MLTVLSLVRIKRADDTVLAAGSSSDVPIKRILVKQLPSVR